MIAFSSMTALHSFVETLPRWCLLPSREPHIYIFLSRSSADIVGSTTCSKTRHRELKLASLAVNRNLDNIDNARLRKAKAEASHTPLLFYDPPNCTRNVCSVFRCLCSLVELTIESAAASFPENSVSDRCTGHNVRHEATNPIINLRGTRRFMACTVSMLAQ